jgi:hypothetical protein
MIETVPLQTGLTSAVEQVLADVIAYLPTIVGAIVVLVVGYIIGRILGSVVTRILRRLGVSRYVPSSADVESGSVERALGKVVAYYVYFVTILAAADILGIAILSELLANLAQFLPTVLGAIVVLVVGFLVGRILGGIVADLVIGLGIGGFLTDTPLERFADTEDEFGRIVGMVVEYYVYLLTLLAAADLLDIPELSAVLNAFAAFIPALIGGFVVLVVGILAAEFVGRLVEDAVEGRVGRVAGVAVRVLIYYITVTMALSTMGFDASILTNFFTVFVAAFFGTLAIALALGLGIGFGYGSKDYVSENIDDWAGSVRQSVTEGGEASPPEEHEGGEEGV